MTEVTAKMVLAACDECRRGCNRMHYAGAMRRALEGALLSVPVREGEGDGNSPSNASRAAAGPLPRIATEAEPSAAGCLLCKGADEDERFDYCRACGRTSDGLILAMANALHAGVAEFFAPMDFSDAQWARLQSAAAVIRQGCAS